jgi:hypothetical protein
MLLHHLLAAASRVATFSAIPCMSCVVDSDSVGSKVRSNPGAETEYAHLLTVCLCLVHAKVTRRRIRVTQRRLDFAHGVMGTQQ